MNLRGKSVNVTYGRQCESAGDGKNRGFVDELVDLPVGDSISRWRLVFCSGLFAADPNKDSLLLNRPFPESTVKSQERI